MPSSSLSTLRTNSGRSAADQLPSTLYHWSRQLKAAVMMALDPERPMCRGMSDS